MIKDCQDCTLCGTRKQIVNGRGNPDAPIWIIGRDPGSEEENVGLPFVGLSGQRLTQLMEDAGLQNYWMVNLVRCHTPDNIGPTKKQVDACSQHLMKEILEHRPEILILLGGTVASFFMGKEIQVSKYRGEYYHDVDLGIPLIVTYHPGFLIRNGHDFDQDFVSDLLMAVEYVED